MTVRKLSEMTGLSKRYLELIESGDRTPSVQTVYRLAEALGVRPAALLQDDADEEPAFAVAS
jgi:transcriptional regulator with XRE-family HTH domain